VVDERWIGEHGIGRFADEVINRLTAESRALTGPRSPTALTDFVNVDRLRLRASAVIFSPGFNAGITRARQLLVIHDLIHLQVAAEKSLAKTFFYAVVVRKAIRRAGVVMTVSLASAQAIGRWLNSPEVKIVVVGNGRSKAFTPAGERYEFGRPTFIYVGNLKPHKNVGVILQALALRPQYQLIVISSDMTAAEALVVSLDLSSQVVLRSGVSDLELATFYRGAVGALQPSLVEGFGLPALEAMSCGTRVAYWDGCESVKEICAGSGVGVIRAAIPSEWATALDKLNSLAATGTLVMPLAWEKRYDWDTVASNVAQVITDACER
jgi:glycosyltransferase involved in cell wall biosynthesis